ncbi:hypothetical protein J6590_102961, partial [Homalodisca vitripennis]
PARTSLIAGGLVAFIVRCGAPEAAYFEKTLLVPLLSHYLTLYGDELGTYSDTGSVTLFTDKENIVKNLQQQHQTIRCNIMLGENGCLGYLLNLFVSPPSHYQTLYGGELGCDSGTRFTLDEVANTTLLENLICTGEMGGIHLDNDPINHITLPRVTAQFGYLHHMKTYKKWRVSAQCYIRWERLQYVVLDIVGIDILPKAHKESWRDLGFHHTDTDQVRNILSSLITLEPRKVVGYDHNVTLPGSGTHY